MKNTVSAEKSTIMKTLSLLLVLIGVCQVNHAQAISGAADAKTRFVEIRGRRIAYRSIGKGTPIILANRFRGTLDTWDPAFLDALARNFNVITFDYSGYGLSTGTAPTDVMTAANDVRDLAEALKLKTIVVGGWSHGGLVAQTVTAHYPNLVTYAILIGTGPPGKNKFGPEKLFFDTALKPFNDLNDEVILFFEPQSEASVQAAKLTHDRLAKRTKDLDVPIPQELWDEYFKVGADFSADKYNTRTKLKATRIPLLIICGDHDISFPVENWYDLSRELPTAQLIVFSQSGHGPQHQFPKITARYITAFVHNM